MRIIDKILLMRIKPQIDKLMNIELQYAYSEGRDRLDLWIKIIKGLNEKKFVHVFDVSKAFDEISREKIISRLKTTISKQDTDLITSFLNNRFMRMVRNGLIKMVADDRKTPQGSCLGPALFMIGVNMALEQMVTRGHLIVSYADDIFVISNNSSEVVEADLKMAMETIDLRLNNAKTFSLQLTHLKHYAKSLKNKKIVGYSVTKPNKAMMDEIIRAEKLTMKNPS